MAGPLILVDVAPRRAADGVAVPFRLAGGGGDEPYPEGYRGSIVQLPKFVAALDFDEKSFGTGGVATASVIEWAASRSDLANAVAYVWEDAEITVRIGDEGSIPPITLNGRVMQATARDGKLQIALADPAVGLKKPFLRDRFEGDGGLEGPIEWAGMIKPRIFGRVWNLPGSPIDPANNIYCFADPLRRLQAFTTVRDKGAATANLEVLDWQGSAAATFAALQDADAPDGGGISCPSIGCIKWWTRPAGDLTADIMGENAGGYVETTARIVERVVASAGGPAFAAGTVTNAAAIRPAAIGLVANDESTTVAQIIDELLGNVSLLWVLTPLGDIDIREWAWGASTMRVKAHSVARSRSYRPLAARRTGYRRNQLPMARNSLAAIVLVKDLEIPPEQFLNSEQQWRDILDDDGTRPEDNATVGAPNGTPVGDRTAEQVTSTLDNHSADWIVQEARNINVDQEIDTAKSDIDDLFATYGFTASAADSASIAQQARDIAQQARDTTLGYVGEVEEDKLAVEGLTTQAINAKTDAVAAKEGAEGAYAGASTERALAVQASRQSSGSAQTLGRSPGAAINQWAVNQFTAFAPVANAAGFISIIAGQARASVSLHLHPVSPLPINPAKTYEAVAQVRRIVDGAQTQGNSLWISYFDQSGNVIGSGANLIVNRDSVNVADGLVRISGKFTPSLLGLSAPPAFARVMFRTPEGGTIEVQQLYLEDIDAAEKSANSAAASLASEGVAIAKATEAGNYASAAQSDRIAAQAANSGAQAQAAIAADKAVVATDAASAAQQQSQLIATYSRAGDNLLSNTTLGTTAGWTYAGTIGNLIEAGINAAGPVYHPVGENVLSLIQGPHNGGPVYAEWQSAAFPVPPNGYIQPYVFANSHRTSAQLYVIFFNASGGVVGGPLAGSGGAINVPGNDPNNWVRIGTKAMQVPATAISAKLFLRKLDTNAGQSDSYSWFWRPYVGVAQPGQTEWNPFKHGSGKAAEDQSRAEVTVVQGALASFESAAAFYEVLVAAAGGNPAQVRMLAGKNGSAIDLVSDVLRIRNKLNGQLVDVATFEGGIARLNAALIRALAVAPTPQSQIFHRVMLEPLRFTGSHGQAIQYQGGAAYESPPTITRDTTGEVLPALPAGEAYDIRPVNITNTGFAVRAVKLVAGGAATQTSAAGSNVGGTPQWVTNKPTSANASTGDYTFSGTVTLSKQGETQIDYADEGNPSTWRYMSSYGGQVQLYGLVGSAWTLLATRNLSRSYTSVGSQAGHDATRSFAFTETVNSNADFGSGANRFGVHPGVLPATTITAFAGVTYNTQTTSSEVALGGTFKFIVSPQTE